MRKNPIYVLGLALLLMGSSQCAGPRVIDPSINAADANDATGFVSGCGSQPQVGFVYCRKTEGDITSIDEVTFYGPSGNNCGRDACTIITLFFPSGEPTLSLSIPKGESWVSVNFRDLTKKESFDKNDRGFWPFIVKTFWKTDNDLERTTFQEGEIRLRVTSKAYLPLHETRDNENFGWEWEAKGHLFRMSTAGRAWVGNP